jgi:hypothetical protein
MTSEERRVIECAQRAVSARSAYVRQRVRWEQSQSIDDMRARMVEAAEYHTAGLGNTRAELALIDAVDALGVARVCVDAPDTGPVTR